MITFNKTYITIGEDQVVPRKINTFVIYFNTPSKGVLESWLQAYDVQEEIFTEIQNNILTRQFDDTVFIGKDILDELHNLYILELTALNEELKFTIVK